MINMKNVLQRAALNAAALLKSTSGTTSRSITSLCNFSPAQRQYNSATPSFLTSCVESFYSTEAGPRPARYSTAASGPPANGNRPAAEGTAASPKEENTEDATAVVSGIDLSNMTSEEKDARIRELEELLGHGQIKTFELNEQLVSAVLEGKEAKDKVLLCLADMENLRTRSAQQVETNRKFAVQGFVKQILEVADNLERAAGAVPEAALRSSDAGGAQKQLGMLLEGVEMTQKVLNHVLKMNGVEPYRPEGEQFDPNLHSALFQLPDPSKVAGTISVVTKTGYRMHDRVLRAAEVGVVAGSAQ